MRFMNPTTEGGHIFARKDEDLPIEIMPNGSIRVL